MNLLRKKLFGIALFNFKKEEPKMMYDFSKWGLANSQTSGFVVNDLIREVNVNGSTIKIKKKKVGRPPARNIEMTPKGLYAAKALNDHKFFIKSDEKYLKEQLEDLNLKMTSLYGEKKVGLTDPMSYGGSSRYGRLEVMSMIERLDNRRRIEEFKEIVDKYPHTTNALIEGILKTHTNLKLITSEDFAPDFPRDAVKAIKEYNDMCLELCGKRTWFYVIVTEKDTQERNRRRDPILLAQSPFGFFWQILGVWDEEMLYLGDL